ESVERQMPPEPAHTEVASLGSTTIHSTLRLVIPSPGRLQESPPSSLRQTPPPEVAAYTTSGFDGATAMRDTLPSAGPSARQAAETDEATRAARNTNAIRSDCNMM